MKKILGLANERSINILSILLEKRDPVVTKELAEEFNVSNRTIRNDLNKLENWLEDREINLVKKPRVGVWLEIGDNRRIELKQKVEKLIEYNNPLSPLQRQKFILKRLLKDRRYTMKSLADELYVSRTTIYNDLEEVEKWLSEYNLLLERKRYYGIQIRGEEKDWRKAVADLLADLKDNEELKEILDKTTSLHPDSRIDNKTYNQLKELFNSINFRRIEEILAKAEEELKFLFTDDAFVGLIIHIAISMERLSKNKDIEMDQEQLSNLKQKEEFKVARFIAEKIENNLEIKIPEAEIGYISLHILGAKLQQNINTQNLQDVLNDADPKVLDIAEDIIDIAEEILDVNLRNDSQLLLGLVLHLRSAINRLRYGLSLRNPLLDRIKNNYPNVFGAAWASSIVFEKHLNVTVTEEEVGYLALHLGAALERIKNKVNAMIVCGSGVGTSQLVATRLEQRLSGIEIVGIMSAHKLNDESLKNIDVIISTIPLSNCSKPVIKIGPLGTKNDIELIKSRVNGVIEKKQKEELGLNVSYTENNKLFNDDLIYIDLELDCKEKVIKFLSEQVMKQGYISSGFIESALAREDLTSTEMKNGVAIPHGEDDYVLDSVVAVATLAKPIQWENDVVDTVFLLALKSEGAAKQFFKHFQIIIENEELLAKIKDAEQEENIINVILSHS
ncbi:BglG family transcription antiterminator [Halanaerocella petrolearia]